MKNKYKIKIKSSNSKKKPIKKNIKYNILTKEEVEAGRSKAYAYLT